MELVERLRSFLEDEARSCFGGDQGCPQYLLKGAVMSVKGFVKAMWHLCSYLFWPQWGRKG